MPPITTDVDRSRVFVPLMPSKATPLPLVNGSDLSVVRTVERNLSIRVVIAWRRGKVKINRLLGNTPPEVHTTHESTHSLPYEIAEMITAHITHDLPTLKACSLTCRSWYIIAVPYIHRTLILGAGITSGSLKPLSKLRGRGLMPLVQEIRVEQPSGMDKFCFLPWAFGRRTLHYFSAFTNVRTLNLQRLDIYSFIVCDIERYFGQFSTTLRSIVLSDPRCTPRQLSHFLSLFSNLDNIKIWGLRDVPYTTTLDAMLVPFSTPKLRGRLALGVFSWVETWTQLIDLCGGLRFRHMELCASVSCTPTLLEACAETLETLRFHATDRSHCKSFCVRLGKNRS